MEIILSEAHPGDCVVLMPMVSSVILSLYLGKSSWASETAQWVKEFAAKPDNLSSIPRTHVVEGEL